MSFGQFAASSQFYLFGRSNCTRNGWLKASAKYSKPDLLETIDLTGRVFMVTGANNGIGKEVTRYLASKGGKVYMICRSMERAEAAKSDIISKTPGCLPSNLKILQADCSLEADIRRMWQEFMAESENQQPRLDALVCNAGTLMHEKTFTSEGVEVTFAAHLLFGTYLLGSLAMPTLEATPESRMVVVSSGGMYNTKFPVWREAASVGVKKYDGQFAYAFAKRGQVLLCERWASQHPKVKVVSCHPGWTRTEGVEAVYGANASYLEPLRTLWEGSEGIAWLCVTPTQTLESGAFYLDRSPQIKHLSGPFFTEGSFTKNTTREVDDMINQLQRWSQAATRPSMEECLRLADLELPLKPLNQCLSVSRFMGKWHVLAIIPTAFEKDASNEIESYSYDETKGIIDVAFQYAGKGGANPTSMRQRAEIKNAPFNSQWSLCPQIAGVFWPLNLTSLILDVTEDEGAVGADATTGSPYTTCMIGVPDRSYLWIMTRSKPAKKVARPALPSPSSLSSSGKLVVPKQDEIKPAMLADPGPTPWVGPGAAPSVAGATLPTSSPSTGGVRGEELTLTAEAEAMILQRSLRRAEQLGYDVKKVMLVEWTV